MLLVTAAHQHAAATLARPPHQFLREPGLAYSWLTGEENQRRAPIWHLQRGQHAPQFRLASDQRVPGVKNPRQRQGAQEATVACRRGAGLYPAPDGVLERGAPWWIERQCLCQQLDRVAARHEARAALKIDDGADAQAGPLLIGAVAAAGMARGPRGHDQVYTVAVLHSYLVEDPRSWVGRTVWLRGQAITCRITLEDGHFRCLPAQPRLIDPNTDGTIGLPLLADQQPDAMRSLLRRLPLLGGLLPAPQHVAWREVATYRVQLLAAAASRCGGAPCYEALLLDSASDLP